MKKKIKTLAQENNQVRLFGEMKNASALSEKKPPLHLTVTNDCILYTYIVVSSSTFSILKLDNIKDGNI